MSFEPTFETLLYVALVYVLSGGVKGVLGIGLPLVSIPLLAGTMGPVTAMAYMVVPTFAVNLWQVIQSGYLMGAFKRFWSAYPLAILGVAIGVSFLTRMDAATLTAMVGVLVIFVSVSQLFPLRLSVPHGFEPWVTPIVGLCSGMLGGISSFLGPFMVIYLVALRISKDEFVGAIALFYLIAGIPFFGGLAVSGELGVEELIGSTAASVMILIGVVGGQWVRKKVSPELFRKAVLIMLILIGANMIRKGFMV